MALQLRGNPGLRIMGAYAPTAQHEAEEKQEFYTKLKQASSGRGYNVKLVMGDFNARVQVAHEAEDRIVGKETFCNDVDTVAEQTEEVAESRAQFLGYAQEERMVLMNTQFRKAEENKATFLNRKEHGRRGPWVRPIHEVLDYVMIEERWKTR